MQSFAVNVARAACALSIVQSARINKGMAEKETTPIDVNAIRKANLRRLIAEAGTLSAFAQRVDVNPDYLSSIVSARGKRNAGDDLMRRVEAAYKLPLGTLDFPEQHSIAAAMAIQSLPENEQQQVFDFITYKIQTTEALTAKEHAASYLKMIDSLKSDMKTRKAGGKK